MTPEESASIIRLEDKIDAFIERADARHEADALLIAKNGNDIAGLIETSKQQAKTVADLSKMVEGHVTDKTRHNLREMLFNKNTLIAAAILFILFHDLITYLNLGFSSVLKWLKII